MEHGFIKYLIDQIEFLREEIKEKNKIIDKSFTLKLWLRDEQNFSYKNVQINKSSNKVDNETSSATAALRNHVLLLRS